MTLVRERKEETIENSLHIVSKRSMLQRRRYPAEIALNLTLDSTTIRTLSRVISAVAGLTGTSIGVVVGIYVFPDQYAVTGSAIRGIVVVQGLSLSEESYEQSKSTIGSIVTQINFQLRIHAVKVAGCAK